MHRCNFIGTRKLQQEIRGLHRTVVGEHGYILVGSRQVLAKLRSSKVVAVNNLVHDARCLGDLLNVKGFIQW